MTIKTDLIAALGSLVANRCYFDVFAQGSTAPVWPSIRLSFISGEIAGDICGVGTEDTDSIRVQVDVAATTGLARDTLKNAIRAAMAAFDPPAMLEGSPREGYDTELKVYQASLDFIIHGSSS